MEVGRDASFTSGLPQQSVDDEGKHSSVLEYLIIAVCAVGCLLNAYELFQFSRTLHRQSEKNPTTALLVNQFSLDGFTCVFSVVCFSLRNSSIQFVGQTGSWLCGCFYSQTIVRIGLTGSAVNLVLIAVQLYVEIQHPVLYRKHFRMWMVWLAIVFSLIDGILLNKKLTIPTHIDRGDCYLDAIAGSRAGQVAFGIFGFVWRHLLPVLVLVCCYLRLMFTVRQRCLASPGHASSSSLQLHEQQHHQQHQEDVTGPVSLHLVKAVETMALLSLFFIIAWSPANIIQLYLMAAGRSLRFNLPTSIAR